MLCLVFLISPAATMGFIHSANPRRTLARMTATETPIKPIAKVPSTSWRFPPVWPFPADFTEPIDNPSQLDRVVTPEIEDKVSEHLRCYLSSDTSILEVASDDVSLIPSRPNLFKERFVVKDTAISSPEFTIPYPSGSFDTVLVSSGVEYLSDPKDMFKEVWRVLKPGGQCFVAFFSKLPASTLRPVRMWTTMSDEQKIWIVGSYFYYSAGEGWTGIEGHDLYSESTTQLSFEKKTVDIAPYVVQAVKTIVPSLEDNPTDHISCLLSGTRHLTANDRKYCALRAATRLGEIVDKEAYVTLLVQVLPQIFSVLKGSITTDHLSFVY
jgi:SAM-dependent methyltransferase